MVFKKHCEVADFAGGAELLRGAKSKKRLGRFARKCHDAKEQKTFDAKHHLTEDV